MADVAQRRIGSAGEAETGSAEIRTTGNGLALAAVCLSSLMFGLEISSVPTILPILEMELHAGFQQLEWIMNAYTIAVTAVLMATGTLADRYGRKRIFVASILVFGLASLVCGAARDPSTLIASRALQGMSGGAMLICQVAILSHQFQGGVERSRAFGAWGIIFGIGLGFGPIVGAGIVAAADWTWVFLIHGLLAIVTAGLALSGVRESRDPDADRLDLVGMATLSISVFALVFYITQGAELGFTSTAGLTTAAVALTGFAAFVVAETRSSRPMFDFSVFRVRAFSGALLGSMGMNFSFWPFMIYLPIFFHGGLGYASTPAALVLLAYTLPSLLVAPFGERLLLRFGPRIAIPVGVATIGLGFAVMWAESAADQPGWTTIVPGCMIAGIGLGLTNTTVTNTTTGSVSPARAGMASGIDMSARMISLALNIALMGLILVAGIADRLRIVLPGADEYRLQQLAREIAAGHERAAILPQSTSHGLANAALHEALIHGFRLVMLYGALAVWGLAALSLIVFGKTLRGRG